MSLQLKFRYRFEAAHRFLSAHAPSCRTPHGHTWYATAVFRLRANSQLDDGAMAAEFGTLKKNWKAFITETVDHSYLHHHLDPIVPTLLQDNPEARLLAFPTDPTTEMIAGLFALKFVAMQTVDKSQALQNVELVGVHIQETPTNSITFKFEKKGVTPKWLLEKIGNAEGWWSHPAVSDRSFSTSSSS